MSVVGSVFSTKSIHFSFLLCRSSAPSCFVVRSDARRFWFFDGISWSLLLVLPLFWTLKDRYVDCFLVITMLREQCRAGSPTLLGKSEFYAGLPFCIVREKAVALVENFVRPFKSLA